jgi:hypothetical protein
LNIGWSVVLREGHSLRCLNIGCRIESGRGNKSLEEIAL